MLSLYKTMKFSQEFRSCYQLSGIAKIELVKEYIKNLLENNVKVLIYNLKLIYYLKKKKKSIKDNCFCLPLNCFKFALRIHSKYIKNHIDKNRWKCFFEPKA